MNPIAEKLFEAQVDHELSRFRKDRFQKTVSEEVAVVFEWMRNVTLNEVVSPEQIYAVIERNVIEKPVTGGITEIAGEMSRRVLTSRHNRTATLEDIFPREHYNGFIDKLASLESAREAAVKRFVRTPAYSRLVVDALFHLVKELLLAENPIIKRLPGATPLVRIGRQTVGRRAPVLAKGLENRIRDVIEGQLEAALRQSEEFLIEFFSEDRMAELGDEGWQAAARIPLSQHFKALDPDDLEDFVVLGYEFWNYFRDTEYFRRISLEVVETFFEKYGDKELELLVEDMGITADWVVRELTEVLLPGVQRALETGYLETLLRKHIEPFYTSKAVDRILSHPAKELKKAESRMEAAKKAAKKKEKKAVEKKEAAKKPTDRKPASKKPAAKKSSSKEAGAKKPSSRKTAPKKNASGKSTSRSRSKKESGS